VGGDLFRGLQGEGEGGAGGADGGWRATSCARRGMVAAVVVTSRDCGDGAE
jgi:hypothetical protein